MKCQSIIIVIVLNLIYSFSFCQSSKFVKPVFKFGGVKAEDFQPKYYDIDSNASAIVLADIGSSKFEGNSDGFFSIVYERFERIRIMKKNGFDYGKVNVLLHRNGSLEEKVENLEATTYNLTDGKIAATKMEKTAVFRTQLVKGLTEVKFSLPEVKEGSIVEYHMRIRTPFFEFLRSWNFQGTIPRLYSQYEIFVPTLFNYVMNNQGTLNFDLFESKKTSNNYLIVVPSGTGDEPSRMVQLTSDVIHNTWGITNVPSFSDEAFTSSMMNYIQKIEFQLNSIRWPSGKIDDRMGSWYSFVKSLLDDDYFGKELKAKNTFATEVDKAIVNAKDAKEKARLIYNFIRDNFTCTDHDTYMMDNMLRKVYDNKRGNVAEINILLTSLLNSRGFQAEPVLLSTRDNGRVNDLYPLRRKYNYVISRLKIDSSYYLLDASDKTLGFGMLPENIYNGSGRLISETPIIIPLSPDSLKEEKFTSVIISNDEKGSTMRGTCSSTYGQFESIKLRRKIKEETAQTYYSTLEKSFNGDIKIIDPKIDSLNLVEMPATLKYDFEFKNTEDLVYFNPFFSGGVKVNPFKSENRLYPVEMPYRQNDLFVFNMEIPTGYKVEEIPKSEIIKLNDGEGYFEYIIGKDEDKIQMRSRLVLNKTTFMGEDYKAIRDFYAFIVKKEGQMIVLKKNK